MDVIARRSQQETDAVRCIDQWIASQPQSVPERLAVITIELQGAGRVRSLLGSDRGESLLRAIHEGIATSLRLSDSVEVLSDSELLVTLFGVKNAGHALLAVRKLSHLLNRQQQDNTETVRLKPVFGVALWPDAAVSGSELVRMSGMAADSAREENLEYVFCDTQGDNDKFFDWNIEQQIERALDNDEFALHYQPQVSLTSGTTVGAEALLRWYHPEQGLIAPGRFIPLVEKSDAIHALTRWCLHTALRELCSWSDLPCPPGVSVNISSRNFLDPSFREVVANALSLWGVPPHLLTLEITEGALLEDIDYATAVLDSLRELGVRISIDDFGTGYSSLAYLKQLPVDELKIDQSFVLNFLDDEHDRNIVETIIKISRDFGFAVVAEGIEHAAVIAALGGMGCETGQGYAISHPLPHQQFCQWLRERPPAFV
jgi:EAL domain-containing protein (putative c-di-GMP-specific phosphodiesterase class I)/GGDEF domain-containing protein